MSFARTALSELRPTVRLAAPVTAGQVGQMLMGLADTVMVGHIGTLALAACAFANNIVVVVAVAGFGILTSVSIRVSHAHGAGTGATMARALHAGLSLAIACGVTAALVLHLAYPSLRHLGQAPGVVEEARGYLLIAGWSLVPAFVAAAARNYLEAQSRPWPAFWIMFGGVLLNVGLNWIFIFGHWGAPAMGLTGAAIATLLSRAATVGGLLWFVWAGPVRPALRWHPDPDWWREQASLLRLGAPAGLQLVSEIGAFTVAAVLIGHLGPVALAAHQIAMTCASTTFMVPLGISMAATVRMAQAMGAARQELLRPIAVGTWALALVTMGATALLFLGANRPIAALFVSDTEVIALAAKLLVIAGIFQVLDGLQVVGSGLLRGLRDTTGPMIVTLAAYWFVALPLGSWLAFSRGDGAPGMWSGLAVGLGIAAAMLIRRFFTRTARH